MPPKPGPAAETAAKEMHATKQRLIAAGLPMLLKHGYNDLGLQALLAETGTPKGSFYHHFRDKEDYALQVVDAYMAQVHMALEACLGDSTKDPLVRVRSFFEAVQQSYQVEGYMGCLLGGLGQELSGVSDVFRQKIEGCLTFIADRMAMCLAEAVVLGRVAPDTDVRQLADLLVNCWEGAALRSRLRRSPTSLDEMLDFYFRAVAMTGR